MESTWELSEIYKKMIHLREIKKNSDDKLQLLINLTFDVMNFPPIRLSIFYVFCQYAFATCLTIYHILDKFDQITLLKYGSFGGIQVFVLINLGSIVFMANYFYEYLKGYKAFIMPLELFDDITFKKVVFIINMIKIICSLNMVLATIAALGFISAPKYFNEKTYLLVWIFENFPTHSNIMAKFVHWTSLPVALVLAGTSLVWTYAGMNGVFQVALLKRMIATITTSTIQHKYRRDSPLYQETTKQKMIICIMTHEILVRYQNIACDLFEAPMMMFAMGSVVLGGALMIEFLSNQALDLGDQYTIYIGIVCFAMAGGISAMLYLIIGQVLKDESEACNYQLRQLPWYDMNSENMKIYSFFLLKTERCVSLSNSLIQVDYILLMRIIKALYSIATLLAQFVASNYSA